ncbi:hypothetical protein HPP92_002019 [Vanilla planifolia]|uniref:Uncharacterized protein n=1 Tax=Vanilla planifolia TaxID=51239 RepID=A0A835S4M0_VANPL|nr:hypothetical protein HPP92_002019 [Vanilla planifolia]
MKNLKERNRQLPVKVMGGTGHMEPRASRVGTVGSNRAGPRASPNRSNGGGSPAPSVDHGSSPSRCRLRARADSTGDQSRPRGQRIPVGMAAANPARISSPPLRRPPSAPPSTSRSAVCDQTAATAPGRSP